MDLRLSVDLLFLLLAAGSGRACDDPEHPHGSSQDLRFCYECNGLMNYCLNKPTICPIGSSKCMNSAIVMEIGGTTLKMKKKECIAECQSGSMNFGLSQSAITCCDTDFCNARDAPDPRSLRPNGRTCYYCDGQSCSNTVSCVGSEDACFTSTVTNRGSQILLKGCITRPICGLLKCSFIQDLSCCEGNLCNGDKGVTPGFIYNRDKSLDQSVTQSIIQSFMHKGGKNESQRIPNNGGKSDSQRIENNGGKSDSQRIENNGGKSDSQRIENNGGKSDSQRIENNGAKSDSQSFLFFYLILPAALILQ